MRAVRVCVPVNRRSKSICTLPILHPPCPLLTASPPPRPAPNKNAVDDSTRPLFFTNIGLFLLLSSFLLPSSFLQNAVDDATRPLCFMLDGDSAALRAYVTGQTMEEVMEER